MGEGPSATNKRIGYAGGLPLTGTIMKVVQRRPDVGYLDRHLWVPKCYISVEAIKHALTYVVTDHVGKQEVLCLWKESQHHLLVPRAFWDPIKLPFTVVDCRPTSYHEVDFQHHIKLDHRPQLLNGEMQLLPTGEDVQRRSVEALSQTFFGGVLQLGCGRGKTVVALYKIATDRVPTLVMCDNTNLLYQWKKEAEKLLYVPGGIGIYGDGKKEWKRNLVLATYHAIANLHDSISEEMRRWFGLIIWDEGHHVGAPTYARTADLFYGARLSLTATVRRDDGLHIISDLHVGPVVYKNLVPLLKPRFGFIWSGMELDLADPIVAKQVLDTNQEVHIKKVQRYFGGYLPRLQLLIQLIQIAYAAGRVVLLLSDSVDEIVNLMALFEKGPAAIGHLYTDIPAPTPQELGETLLPKLLSKAELDKTAKAKGKLERKLGDSKTPASDLQVLKDELSQLDQKLRQHDVAKKVAAELNRRQKQYILDLASTATNSGLLTYDVPQSMRTDFVEQRRVVFAIMKYGKEGMDNQRLDTVILSSLFSSSNGLQQVIGRPTRPLPGKQTPALLAIVDNVGQSIGMSKKLIAHLRDWPPEEGGPYQPVLIGYPTWTTTRESTVQNFLGP